MNKQRIEVGVIYDTALINLSHKEALLIEGSINTVRTFLSTDDTKIVWQRLHIGTLQC